MIDQARLAPMLRGARPLGRLIAAGLLARDEALATLCAGAEHAHVRGDPSGWRTELAVALTLATTEAGIAAGRAEADLRRALAPLLAERRPSAELLRAAAEVNAAAGDVLLPQQLRAIVRREVACELRRGRRAYG